MTTIMIDTIGADYKNIPVGTKQVAGYVTGGGFVPWTAEAWAHFPNAVQVRIDQSPGGMAPLISHVLDVEGGAARPQDAVQWVHKRIDAGVGTWSTIYGTTGTLATVATALGIGGNWWWGHVNCWLADWNLNEAQATALLGTKVAGMTVVAVQWASPSSNPNTIMPGSNLTLKQANTDLSVTLDSWPHAMPVVIPPPVPDLPLTLR